LNLGSRQKGTRHLWGMSPFLTYCCFFVAAKQSKNSLRARLRKLRLALSLEEQYLASERLLYYLKDLRTYRAGQRIGCYLANDGEIELAPLIGRIWEQGKVCYLPVLCQPHTDHLRFALFTPKTKLVLNRYGIPEPNTHRHDLKTARELDVVIVPLVGFDTEGNRLGMGGGFYDRSLQFRLTRRHYAKPHLIGVAHSCQQTNGLQVGSWDVPMDVIVTDKGIVVSDPSSKD